MRKNYWTKLPISIFLIIFSFNAYAVKCNQESPNHKLEGDSYFNVEEASSLTREQKDKISKIFYRFINKRMEGNSTQIECIGTERTAKQITKSEVIEDARITQQSDGKLDVKLELFSEAKNATHSETLRYFGYNNHYHINSISDDNLVISYKLRKPSSGGSIFIEEITEMSIKKRNLVITETRYIGGYFAFQHIRKLR